MVLLIINSKEIYNLYESVFSTSDLSDILIFCIEISGTQYFISSFIIFFVISTIFSSEIVYWDNNIPTLVGVGYQSTYDGIFILDVMTGKILTGKCFISGLRK